jgi:hypothetical protein
MSERGALWYRRVTRCGACRPTLEELCALSRISDRRPLTKVCLYPPSPPGPRDVHHVPGTVPIAAMPGSTERSRGYLRLAAESEQRAAMNQSPRVKVMLRKYAALYRDLAEQIDEPKTWRAKIEAKAGSPRHSSGNSAQFDFKFDRLRLTQDSFRS